MKIFTNNKIKSVFGKALICIMLFILISTICIGFKFQYSAIYIFLSSLCMFFVLLAELFRYFNDQNRVIENAEIQIIKYISGNKNARIECDYEGELYKLFHKINSLVSILNAHLDNELKSKEFLKNTISDISHQLKTPLTALNIYNGIMQSEAADTPEIQQFVNLTEQELDRMEALVQSLLKITKLDSGTIIINRVSENVFEILENVKKHFLFRAKQENKQIILTGDTSITLSCDRNWLTQAIDNIVKNALDHTDTEGQIQIECRQFTNVIQIIIRDNGSGIHPEDLHHIFKRFYRSRFSKDTQGIGLGLPLAKSIIEAHNGTIEVDSSLGMGTAFIINFLIPTKM